MTDKNEQNKSMGSLLRELRERRKELNCLYQLEELLRNMEATATLEELFPAIITIIPPGWQYPDITRVKIQYENNTYTSDGFKETPWQQQAEIEVRDNVVGKLQVSYAREVPRTRDGYFLKEETQLIKAIADRIGHMVLHMELKKAYRQWQEAEDKLSGKAKTTSEWRVLIDLLQTTNPELFMYLSRKMLHYLCLNGVAQARQLLEEDGPGITGSKSGPLSLKDVNQPLRRESMDNIITTNNEIFRIASENLSEDRILSLIRLWIEENKSRFLVNILENPNSSLNDLINAITRFQYLEEKGITLSILG